MGIIRNFRNHIHKAQEEAAAGVKKRKETVRSYWQVLKNLFHHSGQRNLVRVEIPFEQALEDWGITTQAQYTTALRSMLFMSVFAAALFIWCAWYGMRSLLVTGEYLAAAECGICVLVSLCVGPVSFWRWRVLKTKKYVPFFVWLTGRQM